MCRVRTRSKREASSQNLTRKTSHMLNIPYNFLNRFELISKMTRGTSQSAEIHRLAEKSHVWKVETKICAIWGNLGAILKKSSTPKFIMNISFVPSICIHRSIILIFTEKTYACPFFFPQTIFFRDIRFSFLRESSFQRRIPGSDLNKRPLHPQTVI